ncbi:hypothetical protein C9439_07715 [archaeon SCG-AAA382B04]|nr:hypothetical protein C9439_07715 [archaeon SCG-AAA382B04]
MSRDFSDLSEKELKDLNLLDINRRDFLKASFATASALGVSTLIDNVEPALAQSSTKLVWLSGAECAGCSISLLNAEEPSIVEAVTGVDGVSVDVAYHEVIGYQTGVKVDGESVDEDYNALKQFEDIVHGDEDYILVVEGAVQDKMDGNFLRIGGKPFIEHLDAAADNASLTVAVGACACWGGIPGAPNGHDVTGAKGLQFGVEENGELNKKKLGGYLGADYESGLGYPVVNVPGCPVSPEWIMPVVVAALLNRIPTPDAIGGWVDEYHRPLDMFGEIEHQSCTRRGEYGRGNFAETYSDDGCLWKLGCKAPVTYANCPEQQWHGHNTYCMESGGPCIGCTQPGFPEAFRPFNEPIEGLPSILGFDVGDFAKAGAVITAAGIGAHAIKRIAFGEKEEEE